MSAKKALSGWQFPNADPEKITESIKEQGGYSIDLSTGKEPTEGTMVSLPGHEEVIPEESFNPENVANYANSPQHFSALTARDDRHLGAWVSRAGGEKPQVFLDVSQRFPESPQGNIEARKAGVEASQYGIFNVRQGVTESNPAKEGITLPDKTKLAEGEKERYTSSDAPIGEHVAIGEVAETFQISRGRGRKKRTIPAGQYRMVFLNDGDGPY